MSNPKTILNAVNTDIIELQKKVEDYIQDHDDASIQKQEVVNLLNDAIRSLDHAVEKLSKN